MAEEERTLEGITEEDEDPVYYSEVSGEKSRPKSLIELIDEVQLDPSAPKTMTLNDRIKEYVRTMHIPPVTNWRELSDSEEEGEEEGGEVTEDEAKFTAEIEFPQSEVTAQEKRDEPTDDDDWEALLFKEKTTAPPKPQEEVHHLCLLNVRSYGTYFHLPYEEMELRNEEQCYGCFQPGELARCVCCGGSSIISPYCSLPKHHIKQRLVKESRVNHLLGTGRTFSENELHDWESSERLTAEVCGTIPQEE